MAHAHPSDPACLMAHGDLPAPVDGRRLVAVFDSPVARALAHFAPHLGFVTVVLDPAGDVPTVEAAGVDGTTDVVVVDHDRPELGDVLAAALAMPTRWVGVMGSPRHSAPHLVALRERGVAEDDIARVHRPIGLDIGSRSPEEIAVAVLAGLLADRNGRSGGTYQAAAPV